MPARADTIAIAPLRQAEWATLKDLRIRALAESPDAFGPTREQAAREPDAYWQEGARRFATGSQRLFIARRAGEPVALASAVADNEGAGHIGAMWVDPRARGGGLGRRMLETACEWLTDRGSRRIVLWVTEGNGRAQTLYENRGFALTGVTRPLREGSPLLNLEMELRLEG
jgi:GNAT superfamily N-acetyltransferase